MAYSIESEVGQNRSRRLSIKYSASADAAAKVRNGGYKRTKIKSTRKKRQQDLANVSRYNTIQSPLTWRSMGRRHKKKIEKAPETGCWHSILVPLTSRPQRFFFWWLPTHPRTGTPSLFFSLENLVINAINNSLVFHHLRVRPTGQKSRHFSKYIKYYLSVLYINPNVATTWSISRDVGEE